MLLTNSMEKEEMDYVLKILSKPLVGTARSKVRTAHHTKYIREGESRIGEGRRAETRCQGGIEKKMRSRGRESKISEIGQLFRMENFFYLCQSSEFVEFCPPPSLRLMSQMGNPCIKAGYRGRRRKKRRGEETFATAGAELESKDNQRGE